VIQILHSIKDYFSLTKPRVVVLLQITAICSVIIHDSMEGDFGSDSIQTMLVVLIGGYLTAGGANAINMWYDRDIDPKMARTSGRAIPSGRVEAGSALFFGILISILGVWWFYEMSNEVAAFWSAFSVLFYVLIYSIWLKRRTPQNIVIGGIAGSTPPVIGWSASSEDLSISTDSMTSVLESVIELGSPMPWFMFVLIFLWTPPHFWALALYRSEEYAEVGVPMLPNVKGPERTLLEMKVYSILLVLLSLAAPTTLEAVKESHVIYTDVWASMGQEEEQIKRKEIFKKYKVDQKLIDLAKDDVIVLHCLPAHRGEEITEEALESKNSYVFDQAENRLHVQQALLAVQLFQ